MSTAAKRARQPGGPWDLTPGEYGRVNHMVMPVEAHTAITDCLQREAKRLFAAEGMRAFEMPRRRRSRTRSGMR